MKIRKAYALDDVLLVPKYSTIESRSNVDLSVDLGKGIKLDIPVVTANMKNICGAKMAGTIVKLGGLAILHRFFDSVDDYLNEYERAVSLAGTSWRNIGFSVGVKPTDLELVEHIVDRGCNIICVDVAHGDHVNCIRFIEKLRSLKYLDNSLIIAGNVATKEGALRLRNAGADVVKVNVGSGSICTTRIMTGNGVPSMTALSDVYDAVNIPVIADGGIKNSGDAVKCLCYSDVVMLGNVLAGTDEAPGKVITINGQKYKEYAGSSTLKRNYIEGVEAYVPYKGPVENVIKSFLEGIRSGCSYQGVSNLEDLKLNPEFVETSHAGIIESKPHDVLVKGKNE